MDQGQKRRTQVNSEIGERIKSCRLALGMNKAQVAAKAKLTRPCITYYENAQSEPNVISLMKLADAFQISVDYLLGLDKENEYFKSPKINAMFREMEKLQDEDIEFLRGICNILKKANLGK